MGTVALTSSEMAGKLFLCLVLLSAHDVGMIDMQKTDAIPQTATVRFIEVFKGLTTLFNCLSKAWASIMAPKIDYRLAFTQKDNLKRCSQLEPEISDFGPRTSIRISCPLLAWKINCSRGLYLE